MRWPVPVGGQHAGECLARAYRSPWTGPVQTGHHSRHHVTSPNSITHGIFRPVSIGAASSGP